MWQTELFPSAANTSHANATNGNVSFSTVVSVLLATAANAAVLTYFGQFLHIEQVSSCICIVYLWVVGVTSSHKI